MALQKKECLPGPGHSAPGTSVNLQILSLQNQENNRLTSSDSAGKCSIVDLQNLFSLSKRLLSWYFPLDLPV